MKAILALEDGTIFEGTSIGAAGEAIGDVVFTTAMSGFQECLTDPCYNGMILSFTDPIVDNYGVNDEDEESDDVQCVGVVMKDPSETPSNFRCKDTMPRYLAKRKVIGIADIDTRMLTRHLRDHGTMKGIITTDEHFDFEKKLEKMKTAKHERPLYRVASKKKTEYNKNAAGPRVAVVDLGVKKSVVSMLAAEGYRVTCFPPAVSAKELAGFDGILISDGPGNPYEYGELEPLMKAIMKSGIPTLAVGLGNQLMAIANGMKAEKMPFGHHGNHPVKDLEKDTVFATFQNQNYTLVPDSIKDGVAKTTHVNMHDRVIEGIAYVKHPIIGLQFYPDAVKGAHNASYMTDRFSELMQAKK